MQAIDLAVPTRAEERPEPRDYVAEIARDARELDGWTGAGTAFQGRTWLTTWYETIAPARGLEPLLVTLRDRASGEVALRLPLVLRRHQGLRIVEFADLDITDFNAPICGPAVPTDRAGVVAAMKALRRALPPADLLRLAKMPADLGQCANPLLLHPAIMDCALGGNVLRLGDDYQAWLYSLGKAYRKELDRSWRVFLRAPESRFESVTDPDTAQEVMATLERQQGERMRSIGKPYVLDDPDLSRFYRQLVARGVADGSVVVTALRAGAEIVAAVVGVLGPSGFVLIRVSNAGAEWSNCSPGRVIIERTVEHLHARGWRTFDFSIGEYDYKRRMGAHRLPLFDYVAPLGWRGLKTAARAVVVGRLRKYPAVEARLRAVHARLRRNG